MVVVIGPDRLASPPRLPFLKTNSSELMSKLVTSRRKTSSPSDQLPPRHDPLHSPALDYLVRPLGSLRRLLLAPDNHRGCGTPVDDFLQRDFVW